MWLRNKNLFLVVIFSIVISACTSKGGVDEADADANHEGAGIRVGENQTLGEGVDSVDLYGDGTRVYNRDAGLLPDEILEPVPVSQVVIGDATLYFDYDSSQVRDDAREIIVANAKHLAVLTNTKIILEGHGDERGTREYNIALGMRRAEAVRQLMMLYGVSPDQVRLTSYGEERPVAVEHDESAWSLNRRVELKYVE